MRSVRLEGQSVITAMRAGELGSLMPHVVVPSFLAVFLIPEWHLTSAQIGLLATAGAAGMLTALLLAIPAMHSTAGLSLSGLGASGICIGLDRAGVPSNPSAWMVAFAVLVLGILAGPLALYWSKEVTPRA